MWHSIRGATLLQPSPAPKSRCHVLSKNRILARKLQPSPAPKSRCHLRRKDCYGSAVVLQPSPAPKSRCHVGVAMLLRVTADITTLTSSEEPVSRAAPIYEGQAVVELQPSPAPKSRCHNRRQCVSLGTCDYNPHQLRRAGVTAAI